MAAARSSVLKSQSAGPFDAVPEFPSPLAWAMEIVAFASSLVAVVTVLAAGTNAAALGAWGTAVGVGVIMGAALLHILLVPRWQAEWLVYLAQAVMLGAYVDYRLAFPQPIAFDAIVLTLLGYLDLGIAEVLERLQLKIYARPARFFSLVLPILPLFQLIGSGGLDEVSLFHLLAAGTFYGIACGQLRWKSLGYAAAVLYNAALWVLWSRLGWKLATSSPVLPGTGRPLDDPVRRGQPPRAGPIKRQHDPHGRPDDHLPFAGRADLAVRELWRVGDAPDLLAGGRLPGDRLAAPDVSLDGAGNVCARRGLRDGPREPGLRIGQVGDHAGPGDRAGDVRGAQREEADCQHDAALFRPGEVVGVEIIEILHTGFCRKCRLRYTVMWRRRILRSSRASYW